MTMHTRHLRSRLKKILCRATNHSTVFIKTFSGLLLLSFVTVLFMGISMNRVQVENYRASQANANLERLRQTEESMNLVIEVLCQSMEETLWSNDFITYLVSPGRTTLEQSYRIVKQIGAAVSEDGLVKSAFLYSSVSEEIHNNKVSCTAGEFEDYSIVQTYLNGKCTQVERSGRDTKTAIVLSEARMFLLQELTLSQNMIGMYACEIDLEVLRATIASGTVLVYSDEEESVFPGQQKSEMELNWENDAQFLTQTKLDNSAINMTSGYYRYDSPENGWIYLLPMDTQQLQLHIPDILPLYIAASLLFLVISFFFDYYISITIYQPVNRLLQVVSRDTVEPRLQRNISEVDFLEEVYTDAIGSQNRLENMINKIAPEILDSMLKNLLVGKSLSEKRVAEILEGVGNPIAVQGRFLVAACRFVEREDRRSSDVELNLHLLSIRKSLSELKISQCRIYDIHTEKMEVAVVLCFSPEISLITVKNEGMRMLNRLELLRGQLPYDFYIAMGGIHQKLPDIRYGYREALEQIQYQQYMRSSHESVDKTGFDGKVGNEHQQMKERVRAMMDQVIEGHTDIANAMLSQILSELRQNLDYENVSEYFMDILTDRAVALPLSPDEQEMLESSRLWTPPDNPVQGDKTMVHLMHYSQTVLGLIRTYSRKNSFRYVRLAKEYIEQHYMDSSLSQNEVCEHIGITASYLSELFTEVGNEKFSGYLASFRVEKACQLLRTTNMTIQDIGFSCGFNSIQNFIRVFKKYRQMTPGKYREEQM